jgi:2Fe-2S ferredoxin
MRPAEELICFSVIFENAEYRLSGYKNEYRSLMALLFDKLNAEDFGQCKGMGRCATCRVRIMSGGSCRGGNGPEETVSQIRLSCQIMVDKSLDGARIIIVQ